MAFGGVSASVAVMSSTRVPAGLFSVMEGEYCSWERVGGLSFTSSTSTSTVADADWVETGLVPTSNAITVSVCEPRLSLSREAVSVMMPVAELTTNCLIGSPDVMTNCTGLFVRLWSVVATMAIAVPTSVSSKIDTMYWSSVN